MSTLGIQRDVPLAPLTTLELGGPAKYFVRVDDESALADVLRWAADEGMPSAILGGGSNLIVPDEGYDGLVVHMGIGNLDFRGDGTVDAGAGVPWETVVDGALSRDWAGLECLTGIPLEELVPEDCAFGYRDSLFKREPGRFIVCGVRFALRPHGPATVRYAELHGAIGADATLADVRGAVLELRRRKSMLIDPHDPNHRSAGSFFLNPIVSGAEAERVVGQAVRDNVVAAPSDVPRYPAADGEVKLAAGWLIEKAGIA
ncbi:MAG: FAD-binding protein, partial [Deltaproteobacteria bacterium]|nr:FAD-binding protein [Deltaproteobacteria bacterium]